jgi:microcin C transport system substrate-binding protein
MRSLLFGLISVFFSIPAWAAHGYALWGDLKYPDNFSHFDYVNPQAPKGGELRLVSGLRVSTFDKFNPFTIKGNAPAYLADLMFDTLLAASSDETDSAYALLAQSVETAPDNLSVVFKLNPAARFHNGDSVMAADVKFSFDTYLGPHTSPAFKTVLADLAGVDVVDERTVRFRFSRANREMPLTVGTMAIFSRNWGMENGKVKSFDKIVMDHPIGSGPYKIGPVKFGKDITYVRDPNYWARDLNVRKGTANFDRVTVKIYKDNTAKLEAVKAGEFDLMRFFSAGDWARRVNGKRFDSGELVKAEFNHRLPTGFQSFVFNTRRPLFQDARVREAIGLALDYEWMNRQMFYGAYQRVNGLFGNTDCQAKGNPTEEELALLEPWRQHIPAATFGPMALPPRTDGDSSLRNNLRRALVLLKEAGWEIRDGKLRNGKGEIFRFEFLDSNEGSARLTAPWARNLEKIGIELIFRPVDFSLYQERLQKFQFDMVSIAYPGTNNPGQEYVDFFGSKAADTEDSGNLTGIKNPAVDALLARLTSAKTKAQMLPACRALERVIVHSHIFVPEWFGGKHRIVYNARRLGLPPSMPPYAANELWAVRTWWAK